MTNKEYPTTPSGIFDKGFLPIERRILDLSLGNQRGFLILRLILATVLFFQVLAAVPTGWMRWIMAVPFVYAASAALIYWLRKSEKLSDTLSLSSFVLDIGACLSVLLPTGGERSDVYMPLLLLILGSCLLRKPIIIFTVSIAAALAYALLALPVSLDQLSHVLLLRMSLFLLIALFSVHLTDYVGWIERQTAKRYEERLAWMQRLSMVGRAMAAVLHEAKTPLGTIVLSAESAAGLIRAGKNPGPELAVIAEEADHAVAILQNFLDFVKPTRLDLQPLRFHEPLLQAVDMARIRLDERDVKLGIKPLSDCLVLGSPRHLVQAFSNIINNAVDAMPSGGELTVWMETSKGRALIHFEDTGAGMSPQVLERLFEPFATSKSGEEGHGLGLSIVRWIMVEHGGDIQVRSGGPGKGARVTLVLPLAEKS